MFSASLIFLSLLNFKLSSAPVAPVAAGVAFAAASASALAFVAASASALAFASDPSSLFLLAAKIFISTFACFEN